MLNLRTFLKVCDAAVAALLAAWLCPPCGAQDVFPGNIFCTQLFTPPQDRPEALRMAAALDPSNPALAQAVAQLGQFGAPGDTQLALDGALKWKPGSEITVGFLDGDPLLRWKVEQYARQWEQFADVRFTFGAPDPMVRITFNVASGIGESVVGTDASRVPRDMPTMRLGLTATSREQVFSGLVLHEFGHVLGAIHEHQRPDAPIPWNREEVYKFYAAMTPSRDRAWVDANVFPQSEGRMLLSSPFDKDSIMMYPVPKELTDGRFEVGFNYVLSPQDKATIRRFYRFPLIPGRPVGSN